MLSLSAHLLLAGALLGSQGSSDDKPEPWETYRGGLDETDVASQVPS